MGACARICRAVAAVAVFFCAAGVAGAEVPSPQSGGAGVKFVEANGLRVAYTEHGSGRAVVLLHGGGLSAAMWAKQIPALEKEYRVIAPDTRGHGKTDNPGHEFSYRLLADDVVAFCRALGVEKPVLMGYSDGGAVALSVGVFHPDFAKALILGGLVPPREQADFDHYFAGMKEFYAPVTKRTALTEADLDAMYDAAPEAWDAAAKMHAKPGRSDYWRTLMQDVWEAWNTPQAYSYTLEQLQNVKIPVLVFLGDRDQFFRPEGALRLCRDLPQAELAVIPGAHGVFRARPELFNAVVLDFLKRLHEGK